MSNHLSQRQLAKATPMRPGGNGLECASNEANEQTRARPSARLTSNSLGPRPLVSWVQRGHRNQSALGRKLEASRGANSARPHASQRPLNGNSIEMKRESRSQRARSKEQGEAWIGRTKTTLISTLWLWMQIKRAQCGRRRSAEFPMSLLTKFDGCARVWSQSSKLALKSRAVKRVLVEEEERRRSRRV